MVVIEGLPFGESLRQIDAVGVTQELVEFLLIRSVRAFDLPVELRRPRLNVDVSDALIGQMPMEQRLELMPAVRPHGVNPERELLDDMVDEGNRVLLGVTPVDLESPHPGGIIDRRVLVTPNPLAVFALQRQELHVDLHVMAGDLFLVPMRVHGAPPDAIREPIHAMALEGAVHRGVADPDVMVALQVPDNPDRPEVIGPAQMEDLVDDRWGRGLRVGTSAGLLVDQPSLALLLIGGPPQVEEGSRDAEVAARLPNVARPRRMLQRPDLPPNVLLSFGHCLPPSGAPSVQRGL